MILDRILEHKKAELRHKQSRSYLADLKAAIRDAPPTLGFAVTHVASVEAALAPQKLTDGERHVEVNDALKGQTLVFERHVRLPAGRIQPKEYPAFLEFTRRADEALAGSVRVRGGK